MESLSLTSDRPLNAYRLHDSKTVKEMGALLMRHTSFSLMIARNCKCIKIPRRGQGHFIVITKSFNRRVTDLTKGISSKLKS